MNSVLEMLLVCNHLAVEFSALAEAGDTFSLLLENREVTLL